MGKQSTTDTSIKGGGRARLSEDNANAIIDLLWRRNHHNDDSGGDTKEKSIETKRKKFIKRLVERYTKASSLLTALPKNPSVEQSTTTSSASLIAKETTTTDRTSSNAGEKVRLILVEAIFSKSDKKNKSHKSNGHKKSGASWKEGSVRKTVVLPRHTPIQTLLQKEAKTKLNLKQPPVRCFAVVQKQQIDIPSQATLAGLTNGTILYVTTTTAPQRRDDDDKNNDEHAPGDEVDQTTTAEDDPLRAVKEAYAQRRKRQNDNSVSPTASHSQPQVKFTDCLDQLPPLSTARAQLPAAQFRAHFLTALDNHRVVIICGATGCGKSTQIPQYILEGMMTATPQTTTCGGFSQKNPRILVTQPRRVAAMSLAERVAMECESPAPGQAGAVVGYHVRLDRRVSAQTQIVYCTTGILLRMLVDSSSRSGSDDSLTDVSYIIVDEVHERDLNTDFFLTVLRPILAWNTHLKLILMSATANPQIFVDYFGNYLRTEQEESSITNMEPVVLHIPGRTFPVSVQWLDDCETLLKTKLQGWENNIGDVGVVNSDDSQNDIDFAPRAISRIDNAFLCKLIESIVNKQKQQGRLDASTSKLQRRADGALLVFLPGTGEIEALAKVLSNHSMLGDTTLCQILKLHSTAPQSQQRLVFQCAKAGTVKIVLSTNVAETSVTIPDISFVIDTGRVKESRFNPSTRIKELVTVWTSQASAKQRAGRAGRTGPGVCYRLYTESFFDDSMPEQTKPEIARTPLDELVLQCCLLEENSKHLSDTKNKGTMPIKFLRQSPESPTMTSLLHSCDHLLEVGSLTLTASEPEYVFQLTPLGYHLAHLPMDAKVAKVLIIGCILKCVEPALTIAACLSHSKSVWLPAKIVDKERLVLQKKLVEDGFGGKNWPGGTVKSDLIAVIAAYNAWSNHSKEKDRCKVSSRYALDHNAMTDIHRLRLQFKDALKYAGFLDDTQNHSNNSASSAWATCNDDALFTSCCLVAGLYPNIATLMRPRKGKGGLRGGRLITKNGDICKVGSSSFQSERLWNASEDGPDAYAVYHGKHRSIGTDTKISDIYLNEVNFVSRFALLLFAGNIELRDNALILDGWLKFKVGDEKKGKQAAVLILELRKELDNVMTTLIHDTAKETPEEAAHCEQVLQLVRKLLQDESA